MTIHFDLDNTICINTDAKPDCWTAEECMRATPIQYMITAVNKCYESGHTIIIYTARREEMRHETKYWLKKHGVKFHCLDLGNKAGSDLFVDDKALTPEGFLLKLPSLLNTTSVLGSMVLPKPPRVSKKNKNTSDGMKKHQRKQKAPKIYQKPQEH